MANFEVKYEGVSEDQALDFLSIRFDFITQERAEAKDKLQKFDFARLGEWVVAQAVSWELTCTEFNFFGSQRMHGKWVSGVVEFGFYQVSRDGNGEKTWGHFYSYCPATQVFCYQSDIESHFDYFQQQFNQILDGSSADDDMMWEKYRIKGLEIDPIILHGQSGISPLSADLNYPHRVVAQTYRETLPPIWVTSPVYERLPIPLGESSPEFCCNLINQAIEVGQQVFWQPPDSAEPVLLSRASLARDDGWFCRFESIITGSTSIPEGSRATWLVSVEKVREFVDILFSE